MTPNKFKCPACDFQIFNRRIAKCEACGAALPAELLLTREQVAKLDAQYEQSRRDQEKRLREARGRDTGGSDGGGGFDSSDFGDGGGGD